MADKVNTNSIGFMNNNVSIQDGQSEVLAKIKSEANNVAESIHRILNTLPGSRPGQPNFGCEIRRLLFEPNDFFLKRSVDFFVRKAIADFEPRVTIRRIYITPNYATNYLEVAIWFNLKQEVAKVWTITTNLSMTGE